MRDDGIQHIASSPLIITGNNKAMRFRMSARHRTDKYCRTEFDIRGIKQQETVENCVVRSFMVCTANNVMVGVIKWWKTRKMGDIARIKEK
jgi:hypothetical protein